MFVYIDESGNSGKNIADKNSPYFYHMALFSKFNLDLDLDNLIKPFLDSHKQEELHATDSPEMLEELSPIILKVLKNNNVSFYYSEIEKSYLAYAKLFDTLFDNVENLGARWFSYQLRPLRLMLLSNLIYILDEAVAFDFYKNCLMANSQQQAEDYLKRTCRLILEGTYKLRDNRSKQIIEDAIRGAKEYAKEITMFEKSKQDRWRHLPHIVSFFTMLNAISVYSKQHNSKVQKIVHDEQEQIHNVIIETHRIAAESGSKGVIWDLRENGSFNFTRIPEKSFELKDSTQSYGVQITDVCLYIFSHGEPDSFYEPNKYQLYEYIKNHIVDEFIFSKRMLQFETMLWYKKIMNADLSTEQIEFGKQFVEKMDNEFYKKFINE